MGKFSKIIVVIIGILVVCLFAFPIVIAVSNDVTAMNIKNSIRKMGVPDDTEYVESFSRAGKMVGSGNGMQYLGGILIRSDLPIEELKEYYKRSDMKVEVEKQTSDKIEFIEIKSSAVSLKEKINSDDYYIVYSWGGENTNKFFSDFDLRGH